MAYTNSNLVSHVNLSPNHSGLRNHNIDTISIHCVVGQLSVETIGSIFANPDAEASSNYGIGSDGRIGMYVEEKNRSWCTSSSSNDNRAVTIEVASDTYHPYAVNSAAYASLIKLCADICKRNGIKKLLWKGDKNLIGQIDKQNMTVHRWFSSKACPGDYLYNRHGQIANEVNALLGSSTSDASSKPSKKPVTKSIEEVAKEVIAGKWGNGPDRKSRLESAGYNYNAVQNKVNELLDVSNTSAPAKQNVQNIKKATDPAASKSSSIAGTYKVTASNGLNVRNGAGVGKPLMIAIPYDTRVKNYGYYTEVNGVKWFYVDFTYNGIRYNGFCSSEYLARA